MTHECPVCGIEIGLPEWAQKAIIEAIKVGVVAARAESEETIRRLTWRLGLYLQYSSDELTARVESEVKRLEALGG